MMRLTAALLFAMAHCAFGQWVNLLDPKLSRWEPVGDGIWSMMKDGTLVGQRNLETAKHQAWLYTREEYGEFDLHVEYWLRRGGNSGVSIRDTSRAKWVLPPDRDDNKTPSHIGYEIQLSSGFPGEKYPSGSVYLFAAAKEGAQLDDDWNSMDIESRRNMIRVRLNGRLAAEHPGEPGRPMTGPIGLQIHDPRTVVMFRNLRIQARTTALP